MNVNERIEALYESQDFEGILNIVTSEEFTDHPELSAISIQMLFDALLKLNEFDLVIHYGDFFVFRYIISRKSSAIELNRNILKYYFSALLAKKKKYLTGLLHYCIKFKVPLEFRDIQLNYYTEKFDEGIIYGRAKRIFHYFLMGLALIFLFTSASLTGKIIRNAILIGLVYLEFFQTNINRRPSWAILRWTFAINFEIRRRSWNRRAPLFILKEK